MLSAAAMLAIVGGLVAAGLALSFYGSSIITGGLEQAAGPVGGPDGAAVSVDAYLEPPSGGDRSGGDRSGGDRSGGVFVVQVMDPDAGAGVRATVAGPSGAELAGVRIDGDSREGYFEIAEAGEYELRVYGSGPGSTEVVAVIGALPGTELIAVGYTGFYLIVAGLIGMAAVGVIAVRARARRRPSSSAGGGR